jgi:hypothetical protein
MTASASATSPTMWSVGEVIEFEITVDEDDFDPPDVPTEFFLNIGVTSESNTPTGTYSASEVIRLV